MYKLLVFAFVFIPGISYSQQPFHLNIFGGVSNYQGDLVDQVYVGRFTKAAIGVHLAYEYRPRLHFRGGLVYTQLTGNDHYNSKEYLRPRNLNFQTSLTEFSAVAELYTFNMYNMRWSPYVFGGFAVFRFNPYTFDSVGKVFLQPLGTEGQGLPSNPSHKPYSLIQLAVPFGAGVKYGVTQNFRVGLEFGLRKLFTDYLDDISTNYPDAAELLAERGPEAVAFSYRGDELPGGDPVFPAKGAQRGGSVQKDYYYFTGLTLTFRLGTGYGVTFASGANKRKDTNCPKIMASW